MAKLKPVGHTQSMLDQSLQSSGAAVTQTDGFIIWPVLIPVATAIAVSSAVSFTAVLSLLAPILGVRVIRGWLIGILVAIGLAGWKRAWRRLAALLAIPAFAVPTPPISMIAGDYVHFLFALPYCAIKIASSGAEPGRIYFHWWRSAGLVPSYERHPVYDFSDELTSHAGKVEPWQAEPAVKRTVRHFIGHFCLVEDYW